MDNKAQDTIGYGRGWHRCYTEAPNELWDEKCSLAPNQVVVYIYLLSCVNLEHNSCTAWPSYETIAKKTRIGRSTAVEIIKTLDNKGYIFKRQRVVDGAYSSNIYLLNHPTTTEDWE